MNVVKSAPGKRLRIAWCSSTVFPEVYRHLGKKPVVHCPWKSMLLEAAKTQIDADWLVIAPGKQELSCDFQHDGIRYVVLGHGRRLQNWTYDWRGYEESAKILSAWQPDLVHVHGSENYFGLLTARHRVRAPTLIALQGLLGPYCDGVWGPFSFADVLRVDRWQELLRGTGLWGLSHQWQIGAVWEREILRGNEWFAGRTEWDRAHSRAINGAANYRVLAEILRPEFAQTPWTLPAVNRHTVFYTNLSGPHKGGDILVEALRIVKQTVPDVRLRVGGSMSLHSGYGRHLIRLIARAGLTENVRFLGYLEAADIAHELSTTHVFASASYLDNSPNTVGEAMTVGAPCVCSYVGGLPSLGEHGREMMFFPAGDATALAATITALFENDALAERLSLAARKRALAFHDPETTVRQLIAIYAEMLATTSDERTYVAPRTPARTDVSTAVAPAISVSRIPTP